MALEDLLGSINDEAERGQLSTLLGKYGNVKTALELGEKVVPVFEKVKGMNLDPAREIGLLPDWLSWRVNNTDPATGKIKLVLDLEAERAALQAKVVELEAARGTEMTNDEVKALAESMFNEKLEALRKDPNNPLIDKQGLIAGMGAQAQRFQELYRTLTPMATEHVKKYNEPIPIGEVLDYIEKTGERDPKKAYEAVCAPRDTQLKITSLEAENQKKFDEGKAAGIAEAQARVNGQRMPVDGGGSQRTGSHFMRKIFGNREKRNDNGNQRLGSGFATQAGFADYQKRAMGGGSV